MTRVLFTSMPMAGHLRPGLPIAAQLVADGHEVAWYTGANYAHLVERHSPFLRPAHESTKAESVKVGTEKLKESVLSEAAKLKVK